ncbi:MAG: peptide chain release factor 1 [Oscillospiraceae bacterium]|nr:peptide chain release factor 1 [Oscillospiraceae bacterium]MBR5722602.1 peptide chain release factor 1 [Oscillospiraceae bacterium]
MQTEEQLRRAEQKYDELTERLQDGSIAADPDRLAALMKEYKQLTPVVEAYRSYTACRNTLAELDLLLSDPDCEEELRALANEEKQTEIVRLAELEAEISRLLMPENAADARDVIVEIRSGAGGEEAALFAHSLHRMYSMYADRQGWTQNIMSLNATELGGTKEVIFSLSGDHVYQKMKFESGVHRVQRVPETESQGRVHTSTVTVAVLQDVEDVELELNPNDLRIDVFRSSGAGGQHINKTSSAIRVTHIPTGMVVECQNERSQFQNKDKALSVLRARLFARAQAEQDAQIAAERRTQVGSGDRSEKIRTYNFPQSRLTDHRIGFSLYRLEDVMNGDLDAVFDALIQAEQAERLAAQGGQNE